MSWHPRGAVLRFATVREDRRRLLFVDDDAAFLRNVELVVDRSFRVELAYSVGEALAVRDAPDVAFVDLGLPDGDGVELVRRLQQRWPETPLIVLTVARADHRVLAAFNAGARGYLLKEDVGDRLTYAVDEALAGGAPMSASVARRVLRLLARVPEAAAAPDGEPLTERELNVVQMLASGCSYVQAGASLSISVNTIRTHVRNVYKKLAVSSKTEAVMAALRLGLLNPR